MFDNKNSADGKNSSLIPDEDYLKYVRTMKDDLRNVKDQEKPEKQESGAYLEEAVEKKSVRKSNASSPISFNPFLDEKSPAEEKKTRIDRKDQ